MTDWERFEQGQLIARVDGGPAGVYYCETVDAYREAVTQVILGNSHGLWETTYYTHTGKPYVNSSDLCGP
jgi:hypothetical protein